MVDALVSKHVNIEDVIPVINVCKAEVSLKSRVVAEVELTFHIDIKSVIYREFTLVKVVIYHSYIAIFAHIDIADIVKLIMFVEAANLGEGESGAEVPSAADLLLFF